MRLIITKYYETKNSNVYVYSNCKSDLKIEKFIDENKISTMPTLNLEKIAIQLLNNNELSGFKLVEKRVSKKQKRILYQLRSMLRKKDVLSNTSTMDLLDKILIDKHSFEKLHIRKRVGSEYYTFTLYPSGMIKSHHKNVDVIGEELALRILKEHVVGSDMEPVILKQIYDVNDYIIAEGGFNLFTVTVEFFRRLMI